MADGLREALSRFVPESVLDEAVEEIKNTEVAPEWYRNDIAKVGAEAKEAQALRTRLASIESAPKRKEALKRVGIDYDAVPKYGQKALDELPVEDLEDLEKVAQYVQEQGFEAQIQAEDQPGEQSGARDIVDFTSNSGSGAPVRQGKESLEAEFQREMDQAQTAEQGREVLAKYGRLAQAE